MIDWNTIDEFHRIYYGCPEQTIYNTQWLGVTAQKYPGDLWIYQEIITELRPDFIIETGTYWGGSALFLASICDLLGRGRVITVDTVPMAESQVTRPAHARITYLTGSSIDAAVVEEIRSLVAGAETVMVILDSDHSREHVINELKIYSGLVTQGSYLIVEDTNINGHPVLAEFGPGPMEAVELFLSTSADFLPDRSREKFLVTANPKGFLRRVEAGGAQARLLEAEERARDLERRARDLERRARDLELRLAEADALAQARDGLVEDRALQVALLEERLEAESAARNEAVEAHRQLRDVHESVQASASWGLTAPLRSLKRLLTGRH
jgi:cephalosporin hydroxylase